jgi:hypothetical protein
VLPLVLREDGARPPALERGSERYFGLKPVMSRMTAAQRVGVLHRLVEPTLQRELRHRGVIADEGSYTAELVTWMELS